MEDNQSAQYVCSSCTRRNSGLPISAHLSGRNGRYDLYSMDVRLYDVSECQAPRVDRDHHLLDMHTVIHSRRPWMDTEDDTNV